MSRIPPLGECDSTPAQEPRPGRRAGARVPRRGIVPLALVGAGVALALALASDPVGLARFAGRVQAVRAGAVLLGQDGLTLQSGLHDCGPAALANLLLALGREALPLDSLGQLAGTLPSGTRTSGLIRAGAELGVPLTRWSGPPASDARTSALPSSAASPGGVRLPVPSIAWVHRSHFVTVVSQDVDGRVVVLDPLVGRYSMSVVDFRRIWSGEVLLIPQETPPLVATSVAALSPLAWRFPCEESSRCCSRCPWSRAS